MTIAPAELRDNIDWAAFERAANGRQRRAPSPRRAALRGQAGAGVIAAMIGAQIAEEAMASADDHRGGFDWLFSRARICTGRHDDNAHEGGAADDALISVNDAHTNHFGGAPAAGFSAAGAIDVTAFDGERPYSGGGPGFHGGRGFQPGRGRPAFNDHDDAPQGRDVHTGADHAPPAGAPAGGPAGGQQGAGEGSHAGGNHSGAGGGQTGEQSGDQTGGGQTGGQTGGHSSGHGGTAGGAAEPLDAAMQADHDALMRLAPVSAATHVAVKDGSWFDPRTWAGGEVPGEGARVVIPAGVTVAYDGESPASIFTVRVDGALEFATDRDTFLEVDTLIVTDAGALVMGTKDDPVDADVRAVIQIADNGPIDVEWDPRLLSRGIVTLGSVEINGAEKETFLKVAVDPLKGDTTLTLEAPPEGWQVGDRLVLTGTHLVSTKGTPKDQPITVATEDEELVITAINGDVVTFDRPLQYDHEGPRADLKAYVANYSRNVVIETENAEAVPVHQRGHVMLMHSNEVAVRYAEFSELGRTDKSERAFDVGDLANIEPDSNVKGRYSLHIHRSGVDDQAHPVIVEGASVWGSPGWGFVHHDSNAIFADNAAYDVFGAAFVAETGNETGRWVDNIAIKSLGVDHIVKNGDDVNAFDLGRTGTGFWFQGRLVEAVGNVAAGVPSGAGFTYFHRGPDGDLIAVDPASSGLSDALRYLAGVDPNIPAISLFSGNESFATETGLDVIKANPRQGHGVRSVIDGFTAWEVETGVHLQYTAHYTITDLDIVATDGRKPADTRGVHFDSNVIDVTINGASIDGFFIGVDQVKHGKSGLSGFNRGSDFDYVYIDVEVTGAKTAFTNLSRHDTFLDGADLVNGRLDFSGASRFIFDKGEASISGTIVDSIGARDASPFWDPNNINREELAGAVIANGVWTTADGRRVTLIEEYIADRATGDIEKVGLFVELPARYQLPAGAIDNGLLNQASRDPIAGADFASVRAGEAVTIDVLANDRDPDGDKIRLDGLFSDHGRVVANDDGSVTYFADPGFSGEDSFHYFLQDANGDITKAEVVVMVEI